MKKYTLLLLSLLTSLTWAAESPVGYWKTIDDVTGRPKSIIHITETVSHSLIGTVVKIYPKPGKDEHEVCDQCTGEKHNQPIVGMTVMEGLKENDTHQWKGGNILDPENGKTYRCALRVEGNKLNVHGYIGMPLLGRSQLWERVARYPA